MKAVRVLPLLVMVIFALSLGSVYAQAYPPHESFRILGLPILGTTGTPALASPALFAGAISVLYADGTPVFLSTNQVTLNLCSSTQLNSTQLKTQTQTELNSTCEAISSTLKQTAPGTYTYTFTPPTSLTGTVTIYVQAGSLADDNGKIFPSVDTQIGTYAAPSSTASSQSTPAAGTPQTPQTQVASPAEVNKAVDATNTPKVSSSPVWIVLGLLVALLGTGFLLIIPRRH
jgi:cobalamin biosynthesis Mg chelatase CobN